MSKRMLIDSTHEEETRVAVTDGKKLAEYDYESSARKPLKGNIYLAKVTRVEPSLQAAFVNYGGNRHGFLPFSEIHPDYFRIPVADREALIAEQEALLAERDAMESEEDEDKENEADDEDAVGDEKEEPEDKEEEGDDEADAEDAEDAEDLQEPQEDDDEVDAEAPDSEKGSDEDDKEESEEEGRGRRNQRGGRGRRNQRGGRGRKRSNYRNSSVEIVGGEEIDDEQRFRFNLRRKYKIQEVIKRGQIMLVQVNKEERGNKGAAVGSYLSLPGRYCVLMPNSPRGGGVSRKIANYKDRSRMRKIVKDLEVPKGMSVIVRTAGVTRTKVEIKRDLDYLMRLWDNIRELTLQSSAPSLVYEEADLIKRSVRDLYTRDIEEIHVAGEEGYKVAKSFMKMLIPSHVKKVKLYENEQLPLFNRYQIESQIDEIGQPEVRLKSGGYLVINPTEALVSIDVNSGKSTKERHIEETALRTNLESADEVARQLKLRDLGGLVVIDFIDMEDRRNNAKVERRMKEALSMDRARVQVGRISNFGLMELSRQRLSASLTESQYETCPNCKGVGLVRTSDAMSILVLRAIEEEGIRARAAQIIVHVSSEVALYILNNKRKNLVEIEERYGLEVLLRVDDKMPASEYRVEVSRPAENSGDEATEGEQGEEEQDAQKKNERSEGRRRGRRGGRNRNRNRDDRQGNDAPKEDGAVQEQAEKPDKASEEKEEKEKKPESKAKRAPSRVKKEEEEEKTVKAPVEETSAKETKAQEPEGEPKKKPIRRKKAETKKEDKSEPAPKEEKKAEKKMAPAKKAETTTEGAKKPAARKAKPSNDTGKENLAEKKDYEKVNEAPDKKKRGWWNKLVE